MQRSHSAFPMACIFGMALSGSSVSAQTSLDHDRPDVTAGGAHSRPVQRSAGTDSAPSGATGQISTTANNQIIFELAPDDTTPANLFDLNRRTLVFTPDGRGGYSRELRSLDWEDDIGLEVTKTWERNNDGVEISFGDFSFDFAGRRWHSFHLSRHGIVTLGGPLPWAGRGFEPMRALAAELATRPTISALYKPQFGGLFIRDRWASQHVAHWPDRVVITWFASESEIYPGISPGPANRFQAVLRSTGTIQFNYGDVTVRDGVVGLFSGAVVKDELIAALVDATDSELPGRFDLLEAALYTTNTTDLLLEMTTRAPVSEGNFFRFAFDSDPPYWDHDDDLDVIWGFDFLPDGEVGTWSSSQEYRLRFLGRDDNRVMFSATGPSAGLAASVFAGVGRTDDWRYTDTSHPTTVRIPQSTQVDLSSSDGRFPQIQSEAFHYRGVPDLGAVSCRIIGLLGDGFDLFAFHSEVRVDSAAATPWRNYGNGVQGLGGHSGDRAPPCGEGRLLGHWIIPVWIPTRVGADVDQDLGLFAHEFIHTWTASLSYEKNGAREPLFLDEGCRCHWRPDLHAPAAFPWRGREAQSIMSGGPGRFWRDNGDGTFTAIDNLHDSGPSWLDLYAMGLADAGEVPDMFILRNLEPVPGNDEHGTSGYYWGTYRGDKEVVSIEQVIAAEGARVPTAAEAQRSFNAGFVYLVEPGRAPDADMLRFHRDYRDRVIEHWSHVTGGRSRMTATVPGVPNRSPAAVGTLPDLTLHVGGTPADVDLDDAFRDPDGDPLTYRAASSAPAVATAVVAGSRATVTPVSVGTTTVTVTATDTGGASAMQRFAVTVTAPSTFTDHPIRPGTTPIKAVHFRELRERIAALRTRWSLPTVGWTDPILTAGVKPVKLVHLLELRAALAEAYARAGRAAPRWSDTAPAAGAIPIRAVHLMELRAAVLELE